MTNTAPKGVEGIFPYLASELNLDPSSTVITQFKGGYSNLTYLITSPEGEFVLRRPPLGLKISKAHDMVREFKVLKALQKAGYNKIPKPILCYEEDAIIGAPFFIMEKVNGLILRNKIPEGMNLSSDFFAKLSKNTVDGLLALHKLELKDSGLLELGKPEGYVSRQVLGWSDRYYNAKTDELKEIEAVSDWLKANLPKKEQIGFIHNDYKYDNLVLEGPDNPEIKAVLDWEMATVGDPLMDLGTSLAYWAEEGDPDILKMFNLTYPKGNFSRAEVIDYYSKNSSLDLSDMLFYYVFGVFKVGVIAQQIYKRYTLGFAQDPRFAGLIHVVNACGKTAFKSIQTHKI
ncbi:phosphotransferase family protein [Cecembia calidifontis]|jgi:aminoglycoside phosphotransferase (APT) family kinase protein|uniref:Aminoglycoside phosphotransferase (APT) family kinase protein n=1 Tax=Cecembia calidifontis TaxID=1187080 RepID=A0A4Q7PEW6_9BACT|nr:phosphotransferase family protein [Cecembia calidifontis]RZS97392.1 aminoglycoside phosphotransferase (APT) family kinase protein [Cecembia calidifontis]